MLELDSPQATDWIAARLAADPATVRIQSLGGGVSNHVLLVETPTLRCVFKQALGRLRVEQEWLCRQDRIYRECAILGDLAACLPPGSVPAVVLEDQANFTFAMQAAPPGAQPWKSELLAGRVREEHAARAGRLLGAWIAESGRHPEWRTRYGDQTVFDELRLDPYYRSTAARHQDLSAHFAALIEECAARRVSLVHGDFSPKNLLVTPDSMLVIDWEVVHWGDPAFDAAFLTNHLLLKAFHRPAQWRDYARAAAAFWAALTPLLRPDSGWFQPAALRHLGCLLLARVDGKSPAEYLTPAAKLTVRDAARALILRPPATVADLFERAFS